MAEGQLKLHENSQDQQWHNAARRKIQPMTHCALCQAHDAGDSLQRKHACMQVAGSIIQLQQAWGLRTDAAEFTDRRRGKLGTGSNS